jgi:uncharacterized protein with NRDE domain
LIPDYLRSPAPVTEYLQHLEPVADQYSGFNLLLTDCANPEAAEIDRPGPGNRDSLWYVSNRAPHFARPLPPGIYGLSNELLDTPWPKLQRVRRGFDALINQPHDISVEALFAILADPTQAGVDEGLPQTGLSREWEQLLSSPFISNSDYGTRCSTVVMIDKEGGLCLSERRFGPRGTALGGTRFDLAPHEWPRGAAMGREDPRQPG